MTVEPGKHANRGAVPPAAPPPRVSNLPGVPVLAGIVAALFTVSVVLWLIWSPWSDDEPETKTPGPQPEASSFGAAWTTEDGSYRISITPSTKTSTKASPDGCVHATRDGQVNAAFTVLIENTGTAKAPAPEVEVGSNVGPLGTVRQSVLSLDRSSREIELSPRAKGESCALAAGVTGENRSELKAGGRLELRGTLGGLKPAKDGTAVGLALIVRYHQADPTAAGGSTAQEFIVPFDLPATKKG